MPLHRSLIEETVSPAEAEQLERALRDERLPVYLPEGDLHTRGVLRLLRQRSAEWNAAPPTPESIKAPTECAALDKIEILPGAVSVPVVDEDQGPAPLSKRAIHRLLRAMPVQDFVEDWPSYPVALRVIARELLPIEPLPSVAWQDTTSDQAIALMALGGMGAHRLQPVSDGPEGAAFCVDLTWMRAFEVRPGFLPYGACAYFSDMGTLLSIYTAHDDQLHAPSTAGWEAAKWMWKCSLFTGVTVTDHLGYTHLMMANMLVTATRENLGVDHPIRRLLRPYEFRTVAVNYDAALALAPRGGLAHRTFAFTYEGLVGCLNHALHTGRLLTVPQLLAEKPTQHLGDRFPFATDALALWSTIQSFVDEYVGIFYAPGTLAADPEMRAFWRALADQFPSVGIGPLTSDTQAIDLLATFMFTVTGFHEHVGGVAEYILDPTFVGTKVRAGATMADVQSTVQVLLLLAATGFRQPPLLGNFDHLFLDRERARVEEASARYQQALEDLADDIEARNRTRAQPVESFNPRFLQCSVSI